MLALQGSGLRMCPAFWVRTETVPHTALAIDSVFKYMK